MVSTVCLCLEVMQGLEISSHQLRVLAALHPGQDHKSTH
jgi:hypothetical protein